MAFEVKVPAVGESVQEGEIYKWHKNNGDHVQIDDVLVELETDKATVEVVAEASGILNIVVEEGQTVNVGDVLARIEEGAAPIKATSRELEKDEEVLSKDGGNVASTPLDAARRDGAVLTPAARKIADAHDIDTSKLKGTGRGGRIVKEDIESQISKSPKVVEQVSSPKVSDSIQAANGNRGERREKMSRLRQKIAQRLVQAQQEAAMLTTFNEVDLTAVMAIRKKYKEEFKETHDVGLGFMSFFVSAATKALKTFPAINSYIDQTDLIFHDYVDIGVAVSTDKGLMVPVLRDCTQMSFAEIEAQIMDFAVRGRAGKITVDELSGGTFTISNGGVFGSLMSTPILNPPQSAILGMHKIQQRPVAVNGAVEIRPMMYLALSYDHRVVDGKEAVSFLVNIKDSVEDPARLLLNI